MRAKLLASAAVLASAYANTNANCKLYTCATSQPADLTATAFAALTWVEVKGVGKVGETGTKTNILKYDTWGNQVTDKAKGMSDAGDPTVEVARDMSDAGQDLMRAACLLNYKYAFKIVRNDVLATTPTIYYHRGLVTGPTHPNGKNEDFDLDVYALGLVQIETTVDPT